MRGSNSKKLQIPNTVEMAVSSSKMRQIAMKSTFKKHGKTKTIPDPIERSLDDSSGRYLSPHGRVVVAFVFSFLSI
jgi:hypothetical protein